MEEPKKQPKKSFSVSPWPFVVAAIFFAIATHYLLDLYGIVHWNVKGPSIQLEIDLKSIASQSSVNQPQNKAEITRNEVLERMLKHSKRLSEASSSLMRKTRMYHITGIVSLFFTVVAFFGKPRWAGFISLPFSLYAAYLFFIIM